MTEFSMLDKGGPMLYALTALSVYVIGAILFKLWQFRSANIFDRSFVEPVLREIKHGDRVKAVRRLAATRGPVARIMRLTFECVLNREMSEKSREAEIVRVGSADIRQLESHLRGLEMAAAIAPLMGLLGTVLGLITAFAHLGAAGAKVDPSMLAGGIWEALLTTAGGLAVAIPAMTAHYILDGMLDKLRATMKDVSVQILSMAEIFRERERLYEESSYRQVDPQQYQQQYQQQQQQYYEQPHYAPAEG